MKSVTLAFLLLLLVVVGGMNNLGDLDSSYIETACRYHRVRQAASPRNPASRGSA